MTDQVENHILNRYELVKKVGSGAYGHVWKVKDKKSGQTLALKKIFDAFQHSTDAQRTYREIMFLHEFNHENIIKLHNVYKADNDKDLYLVFQFMQADLHNAIGQKILKDVHNRYIMYQIIKGIKYLHSASVIHRDLKPSNILVNSDCHIKICDFGLARSLVADECNQDLVLTQEVATRWYRAPEVLLGSKNYGESADVWSLGCILAEILIGRPFFPGNSTLNQLQKVLAFIGQPSQSDINSLDSQCAQTMIKSVNIPRSKPVKQWFKSDTPIQAIDLVVRMLQFNPQKRIKIDEILRHPYVAQFRDIKNQKQSRKEITPPVSDNKKLNLKQYRNLIYDSINTLFNKSEERGYSVERKSVDRKSIDRKSISSSLGREKEVKQTKKYDYHSSSYHYSRTQKGFYNSISRTTTKTSSLIDPTKKTISHSMSQNNFFKSRNSLNQDETLKRKSSLKDLLQRRNTVIKNQKQTGSTLSSTTNMIPACYSIHQSTGNLLQQYKKYKNLSHPSQKENRTLFGKA